MRGTLRAVQPARFVTPAFQVHHRLTPAGRWYVWAWLGAGFAWPTLRRQLAKACPGPGRRLNRVLARTSTEVQPTALGRHTIGDLLWHTVKVPIKAGLCADADGVSLHAGVHVAKSQRDRLRTLCRYLLRPPLCQERLSLLEDGRVLCRLKRPYSDGTRALVFEPLDFVARLWALVAPPQVHLVHYHGVLGPHAKDRGMVVTQAEGPGDAPVQKKAGKKQDAAGPGRPR